MIRLAVRCLVTMPFLFVLAAVSATALAAEEHALTLHGEPKYGPDFSHFDYVNPEAPKGGELKLANVQAQHSTVSIPLFFVERRLMAWGWFTTP